MLAEVQKAFTKCSAEDVGVDRGSESEVDGDVGCDVQRMGMRCDQCRTAGGHTHGGRRVRVDAAGRARSEGETKRSEFVMVPKVEDETVRFVR